jgi:putative endonuclease
VAETLPMYYVYVLRSDRNGKRYMGSSSKTGAERLIEHNSGTNTFTRHNRPWRLIHEETFATKVEALRREKFLKSGQGRKWLDENVRA